MMPGIISYIESNEELLDWLTMARDFELKIERKPVTKDELLKRYALVLQQYMHFNKRPNSYITD